MELKLYFHTEIPLVLPLGHHHMIQGLIYHLIYSNKSYSSFLHDYGYAYHKRNFKLFTFGPLTGRHYIEKQSIIFTDSVMLELRSPLPVFFDILHSSLALGGTYQLGLQNITLKNVEFTRTTLTANSLAIHMLSPVTVYKTESVDGIQKTHYYTPLDGEFTSLVSDNFFRKYKAAIGRYPSSPIVLKVVKVGHRDKYVTKFKNMTYITGWKGIYELFGEPEYLNFLFHCGIGSKNSQGFGMFEIL